MFNIPNITNAQLGTLIAQGLSELAFSEKLSVGTGKPSMTFNDGGTITIEQIEAMGAKLQLFAEGEPEVFDLLNRILVMEEG